MNEKLLQFIWQTRMIRPGPYYTTKGELLKIVSPGTINEHQGPDFLMPELE